MVEQPGLVRGGFHHGRHADERSRDTRAQAGVRRRSDRRGLVLRHRRGEHLRRVGGDPRRDAGAVHVRRRRVPVRGHPRRGLPRITADVDARPGHLHRGQIPGVRRRLPDADLHAERDGPRRAGDVPDREGPGGPAQRRARHALRFGAGRRGRIPAAHRFELPGDRRPRAVPLDRTALHRRRVSGAAHRADHPAPVARAENADLVGAGVGGEDRRVGNGVRDLRRTRAVEQGIPLHRAQDALCQWRRPGAGRADAARGIQQHVCRPADERLRGGDGRDGSRPDAGCAR